MYSKEKEDSIPAVCILNMFYRHELFSLPKIVKDLQSIFVQTNYKKNYPYTVKQMLCMVFEATTYSSGNSTFLCPETKQVKWPSSISTFRRYFGRLYSFIPAVEEDHITNLSKVL